MDYYVKRLTFLFDQLKDHPKVEQAQKEIEVLPVESKELLLSFWLEKFLSDIWSHTTPFENLPVPVYVLPANTELQAVTPPSQVEGEDRKSWYVFRPGTNRENKNQNFRTQLFGMNLLHLSATFTLEDALSKFQCATLSHLLENIPEEMDGIYDERNIDSPLYLLSASGLNLLIPQE
jgi:hypothetical protein